MNTANQTNTKTAIIYYSKHHGNTKKLLDAIASANDVTLIDVTNNPPASLEDYDRIGWASGIYYSKFHKTLLTYANEHMPDNKETFFIYTYGAEKNGYTAAISDAVKTHNARIIGQFGCFGFNTFGPFKLIGGIAKGHPDMNDIDNVLKFYKQL